MIAIGFDPSKTNCGVAVLYFDIENPADIRVLDVRCINLNTIAGGMMLRDILERHSEKKQFAGWFCEYTHGFAAQGRAAYIGRNIQMGQMIAVDMLKNICKEYKLKPYGKRVKDWRVAPNHVKKTFADNGKADKSLMVARVKTRFDRDVNEHEADAIGVAIAGIKRIHAARAILPGIATCAVATRRKPTPI